MAESLSPVSGKISQLQKDSSLSFFVYYFSSDSDENFQERIFAKDSSLSFQNIPAEVFSLGFTSNTVWFYIPLKNDTEKDYRGEFEIFNSYLEEVDIFYRYGSKDSIHEILAGTSRVYEKSFPALNFYLRPGEEIQIVCKIKSGTPMRIPIVLESEENFNFTKLFRAILFGLTLGFGIAMGLYNFSLYMFFRTRSYLYYFIMILFSTVYLTSWDGLISPLFKPNYGRYYLPFILVLFYTSALFLFFFYGIFISRKKRKICKNYNIFICSYQFVFNTSLHFLSYSLKSDFVLSGIG